MIVAAQKLLQFDYASVGIKINWDQDRNKKNINFKPLWQRATTDNAKEYFSKDDNGIAIVTGEASDIYAGGRVPQAPSFTYSFFCFVNHIKKYLCAERGTIYIGLFPFTSVGYHYFFSLSKSLANGLKYSTNTTKILIDGKNFILFLRFIFFVQTA